ncbi:MAG TPA: GldM family protein [Bacteroidia bacterium]|nr:GldM family protein [Bacteroidia bacterium]
MKKILPGLLLLTFLSLLAFRFDNSQTPVIVVSAEKMNVFMIGLDNPLAVQAPGVLPENLSVSVSGGGATIERGGQPGHYIVRVNAPGYVNVTVGERKDSVITTLGTYLFRAKKIPDPVFYVYNHKRDDTIPATDLSSQAGVFSRMENFDFDCAFRISSFMMTVYHDSTWFDFKANGPVFTSAMKQKIKLLDHGDRVIFSNVNVKLAPPCTDTVARRIDGAYFVIR